MTVNTYRMNRRENEGNINEEEIGGVGIEWNNKE